jgi:type I restriction enzyme M protein
MADDKLTAKADLIWAIADKLTGVYKPHEYGLVILPLTVLKRFDSILKDTKQKVIEIYENNKDKPIQDNFKAEMLCKASGQRFYNISKFTFESVIGDADNIEKNFNPKFWACK